MIAVIIFLLLLAAICVGWTVSAIAITSVAAVALCQLRARTRRMEELAGKYKLSFAKPIWPSRVVKVFLSREVGNVIEGEVSWQRILIYDEIDPARADSFRTVYSLNGAFAKEALSDRNTLLGFCAIGRVEDILSGLAGNGEK